MFYIIQDSELKLFDDNQKILNNTLELMPQFKEERILETDIITAEELRLHPNKVMVSKGEIIIDVIDTEQVEEQQPVYDEEGKIIGYETVIVTRPIYEEKEEKIEVPIYDEEGNIIGYEEKTIVVKVEKTHKEAIIVDILVLNPNYEEEEKEKQHQQFLKQFFNTSLGWVRRKVSMQTGETNDFLADILPILQVDIPILTYTEDGEQMKVLVTAEFIEECKQQVIKDFYGA